MRYLIIFLLLINLVFWVWFMAPWSHIPSATQSDKPDPTGVPPLVLIEEQPVPEEFPAQADEHTKTEPSLPSESILLESGLMPDKPKDIADSAMEIPPEAEVQEASSEAEEIPQSVKSPPPRCHTLGPFYDLPTVQALLERLTAEDLEVRQRSSVVKEQIGYWVFLQVASPQEAQAVVDVLVQAGITDYFVGKNNIISLGAFSRERVADAHRKRIAKLGFAPYLEPRYRTRKAHWLDLMEPGPRFLDDAFWQGMRDDGLESNLQPAECQ